MSGTTTTTTTTARELAYRVTNGVSVSLFWRKVGDVLTVEVFDETTDEFFALEVPRDRALDAFHHPYAYRARAEARALALASPIAA